MAQKRYINIAEYNIDIDQLLDVYKTVQDEAGIDTGLVERDVVIDNDGSIKTVKATDDQKKTPHEQEKDHHGCGGDCDGKCGKACGSHDITDMSYESRLGTFADIRSPEIEADDDDNSKYICEYCTELGFHKEYIPRMCDSCSACDECSEFEAGECSGCSYSSYRTGRLYSEELKEKGIDVPVDEEITELIDALTYDDNAERIPIDKGFSVMDHDHSY